MDIFLDLECTKFTRYRIEQNDVDFCWKIQFRFHTGGGEELHSYLNKDILPNEWGGKAGTFEELNGECVRWPFGWNFFPPPTKRNEAFMNLCSNSINL